MRFKGDGTGDGQGLQNTHGGGGALQHAGEGDTHQNAQQWVGERREDADKLLTLPQRGDGAGHGGHSVHQYGEAQQDIPHMAGGGPAGAHAQDDADDRHDAGDHLGAQHLHKAAAALDKDQLHAVLPVQCHLREVPGDGAGIDVEWKTHGTVLLCFLQKRWISHVCFLLMIGLYHNLHCLGKISHVLCGIS